MSVSIPLANVNILNLKFIDNCTNIFGRGLSIHRNSFESPNVTQKTKSAIEFNDGNGSFIGLFPSLWSKGYWGVWSDGSPSAEWIAFWRSALGTLLSKTSQHISDRQIADWANQTLFFEFFNPDPNLNYNFTDKNNTLRTMTTDLSIGGGCQNPIFDLNPLYLSTVLEQCIFQHCCGLELSSNALHSSTPLIENPNYTVVEVCAFQNCSDANRGNPDLGGIGVCVS
jgi:hypothetical protein